MSSPVYDASVPALVRGLGILSTYMDKAAADAAARNYPPENVITARLAPDMMALAGQIQRASDTAKGSIPRLTGIEAPGMPDTEKSYDELKARLAATIAFLESVSPEAFADAASRPVTLKFGPLSTTMTGAEFVTKFLLPNFYFHFTTAHAILRHNGVAVGKLDYLGSFTLD